MVQSSSASSQVEKTSGRGFLLSSVSTLARVMQAISLARLIGFAPHRFRTVLREFYVILWFGVLAWILVGGHALSEWATLVATYRIVDILSYRVFFLFHKSRTHPWTTERMRESLLFALVNLFELILAFAIVYLYSGTIKGPDGASLQNATDAVYFSSTTMMTVGYGDFVPMSLKGRQLVLCQHFSMALFIFLIFPLVLSVFSTQLSSGQTLDQ